MEQVQAVAAILFESWGHVHTEKDLSLASIGASLSWHPFTEGSATLACYCGHGTNRIANFVLAM